MILPTFLICSFNFLSRIVSSCKVSEAYKAGITDTKISIAIIGERTFASALVMEKMGRIPLTSMYANKGAAAPRAYYFSVAFGYARSPNKAK